MSNPFEHSGGDLKRILNFKVIGIGGAGCNVAAQMSADSASQLTYAVINTDGQALSKCPVQEQFVLGAKLTRGLGAGADPEMGRAAALEDVEKCKPLFVGADVVFFIAGLGGGTGTGATPVLAQAARETGALVLAVVTMPFDFEGNRRQQQAQAGLKQLKAAADAVICVPNQKIFKLIDENTTAREAFKLANGLLSKSVIGIHRTLAQPGLVNLDFADLCAVTRGRHCESSAACVEATGPKRAQVAAEKMINHPLLEGVLADAESVLVSIVAGQDLTLSEVSKLMDPIRSVCGNAHVIFGATEDPMNSGALELTLVAARRPDRDQASGTPDEMKPSVFGERKTGDAEESVPRTSRFVPPAPSLSEETKTDFLNKKLRGSRRKKIATANQGQLPLEIVSKGRFEKSEPTIHQGQDLDVPAYVRRCVMLN